MLRLGPLIFRNVLRNRRRTVLTLGSAAISLALLGMLVAVYQGFFYGQDTSPSEALRLICRHRVSLTQPLPASMQGYIESLSGVERVSAWSWFGGQWREPRDFFARFAVDADKIFELRKDWSMPADQVAAFKRERTACAVAQAIADKYGFKIGDTIVVVGDIYPVNLELKVAGIFKHPKNTECLVFHREYLRELLNAKGSDSKDTVGTYLILARTAEDVPRVARAIDSHFDNSPYPTRTESEKEFGRSFLAFLGNIKLFLAAICAAVTFTILLVCANTVAMSVRERTRETGILRTLGYTPGEILGLIVGESVVISLMGGGIGLLIGGGLLHAAASGGGGFPLPGIRWQAVVIVMGMAGVIGTVAALVPAVVAARKNVVESLRFTG